MLSVPLADALRCRNREQGGNVAFGVRHSGAVIRALPTAAATAHPAGISASGETMMPLCLVKTVACSFACIVSLQVQAETVADPRAAGAEMARAVAAGDAGAIADLYLPNAILLGPGQPAVVGREAIRAAWNQNFATGFRSLTFADVAAEQGNDRAAVLWAWAAEIAPSGQPAQVLRGRSLVYFALTPEGWRISADMWQPMP
jgi:uncharacterized protein (TIGR02246 family)